MQIKKEEATNISTIPIHFGVEYRAFISLLFSYCYCFDSRFQFSLRMWFSVIIITLNFGQSITIIISIRRDSTKMSTNIYYELGTWGNEIERLSPKASGWSSIQSTSWLRSLKNFAFLRIPLRGSREKAEPTNPIFSRWQFREQCAVRNPIRVFMSLLLRSSNNVALVAYWLEFKLFHSAVWILTFWTSKAGFGPIIVNPDPVPLFSSLPKMLIPLSAYA